MAQDKEDEKEKGAQKGGKPTLTPEQEAEAAAKKAARAEAKAARAEQAKAAKAGVAEDAAASLDAEVLSQD